MKKNFQRLLPLEILSLHVHLRNKSIYAYMVAHKKYINIKFECDLRGHHVGEYSNKKTRQFIHDSARNKKRKKKK